MKYYILALFLMLFLPVQSLAEEANKTQYDQAYLKLVETAHSMPADFDFKAARELYSKTSFYSPFGDISFKESLFKIFDKIKQGDQAALSEANKISDQHFSSFKAHSYMLTVQSLPENEKQFHIWALKGNAGAMIDGKDASSPANAIKVLDITEEYFLIRTYFRGKTQKKQSTMEEGGRIFDVMEYTDQAGNAKTAYFDVSIPFAAYPVGETPKQ